MPRTWLKSKLTPVAILCLWSALPAGCEDGAAPSIGSRGAGGSDPSQVETSTGGGGVGGSTNSSSTTRETSGGEAGMAGAMADSSESNGSTTTEPAPGDACSVPRIVTESGFVVKGDSFTNDFRDDLALAHDSCALSQAGSSDAVFQITLEADEELWVTQTGRLDAAVSIQRECGSEQACVASGDNRGESVRYAASTRETVYVVVEAIQAEPRSEDYEIHIDIDPQCGNGDFEGPEECDDGNTDAEDGCAPDCSIEFPYHCDEASPSDCEVHPTIGELGAGETLEPFIYDDPLETDEGHFYTVTFTERVVAELELVARNGSAGIINAIIYSAWDAVAWVGNSEKVETDGFEPGTYLIQFIATSPLPEGFEFLITTRTPPECGNEVFEPPFEQCDNGGELGCSVDCTIDFGFECEGDGRSECLSIDPIGDFGAGDPIASADHPYEIAANSSHYRMIRFLEPVLLSATVLGIQPEESEGNHVSHLRLTNQSMGVLIDQPVTASPLTGLIEVVDHAVPADLYRIEVSTFTGLPQGYTMTLSTKAQ